MGTGTTTATVLTHAIYAEGCKSVAAGMNPMDLRRGIQLAVEHVVADLKKQAKQISTTQEIEAVCTTTRTANPSCLALHFGRIEEYAAVCWGPEGGVECVLGTLDHDIRSIYVSHQTQKCIDRSLDYWIYRCCVIMIIVVIIGAVERVRPGYFW